MKQYTIRDFKQGFSSIHKQKEPCEIVNNETGEIVGYFTKTKPNSEPQANTQRATQVETVKQNVSHAVIDNEPRIVDNGEVLCSTEGCNYLPYKNGFCMKCDREKMA